MSSRATFHSQEFWQRENLKYSKPNFRLERVARIVNTMSKGRAWELLDVGCGPGALATILRPNIQYYGIDIALQRSAPYLMERDFSRHPLEWAGKHFDVIVAAGVFEYMGVVQDQRLQDISRLLKPDGRFVVTYTNYQHRKDNREYHWLYNNIQPITVFKQHLATVFVVKRWFPCSSNWHWSEPRRAWLRACQMRVNLRLPVISRMTALDYVFICASREGGRGGARH